mmetsp:Transcript_21722/g.66937  ORF Transcript_21722/g.66937 Transcript_21722/m.66937 type:complete len:235 (+) Transcript_21722:27-731(+)
MMMKRPRHDKQSNRSSGSKLVSSLLTRLLGGRGVEVDGFVGVGGFEFTEVLGVFGVDDGAGAGDLGLGHVAEEGVELAVGGLEGAQDEVELVAGEGLDVEAPARGVEVLQNLLQSFDGLAADLRGLEGRPRRERGRGRDGVDEAVVLEDQVDRELDVRSLQVLELARAHQSLFLLRRLLHAQQRVDCLVARPRLRRRLVDRPRTSAAQAQRDRDRWRLPHHGSAIHGLRRSGCC